ncbi:unnamed protein product, partial [marine sediment metagenome]
TYFSCKLANDQTLDVIKANGLKCLKLLRMQEDTCQPKGR